MYSKKTKKVFAILLALVLIFSVGATNVWAAEADVPDITKPVSLTVQKYLTTQPSTTPGDGKTRPGPVLTPGLAPQAAPYVEFKLTRLVGVDADTTVENCVKAGPSPSSDKKTVFTGVTDANGQIVWNTQNDKLQQGFYLLEETYSPYDGTVSAKNPSGVLADKSVASIITLPYANATGYNYDVKVFPKNVGDVNTKTVLNQDNAYKIGDKVEWDIKTVITSEKVVKYSITDVLDFRLTYNDVAVAMILPGSAASIPLVLGTDYTLDVGVSEVTVNLTSTGLATVKANKAIAISTVVTTTINDHAFTNGIDDVIVNNAELTFQNGVDTEITTVNIPESASIALASIELTKINKGKEPLANAQFKIAATKADALKGVFLHNAAGEELVMTTDSNGIASASGIPFSEFTVVAGKVATATVYLVETQAPAGYDLLQQDLVGVGMQPIVTQVNLSVGTSKTIQDTYGKDVTYTNFTGGVQVINYKAFTLPITGGAGTIIFTVVGLVMILGATFILIKTRRKEAAK